MKILNYIVYCSIVHDTERRKSEIYSETALSVSNFNSTALLEIVTLKPAA